MRKHACARAHTPNRKHASMHAAHRDTVLLFRPDQLLIHAAQQEAAEAHSQSTALPRLAALCKCECHAVFCSQINPLAKGRPNSLHPGAGHVKQAVVENGPQVFKARAVPGQCLLGAPATSIGWKWTGGAELEDRMGAERGILCNLRTPACTRMTCML
jgi:hypothetical protein